MNREEFSTKKLMNKIPNDKTYVLPIMIWNYKPYESVI